MFDILNIMFMAHLRFAVNNDKSLMNDEHASDARTQETTAKS
jgi:hypothetical protein